MTVCYTHIPLSLFHPHEISVFLSIPLLFVCWKLSVGKIHDLEKIYLDYHDKKIGPLFLKKLTIPQRKKVRL